MEESLENSIALHHNTIMELEKIKERVSQSKTDNIRFKVETKRWIGYSEPHLEKVKSKLEISKYSANLILETAIKQEKERINKLIDMELELRNRKQEEK